MPANTEVFERNGWPAPTSWKDLEDPKYAGKLIIPPVSNGFGLLTLVMQARLNGGSEIEEITSPVRSIDYMPPQRKYVEVSPEHIVQVE